MRVLICGGAGYIGSHMAYWMTRSGHDVVVLDNLSTGHAASVRWCELVRGDLRDHDHLQALFSTRNFDAVMHFCALSVVSASVSSPNDYYANNVVGTLNLLDAMRVGGVSRLVFSSTAAVYGHPNAGMIDEEHPQLPINPYGASKHMAERMLHDAASAYAMDSVALRYFNAAGASDAVALGELHDPETHLIPNVLRAAIGAGTQMKVFGDDYPTPDGTCVRDYVHVDDLAQAHELALDFLALHAGAHAFNLGNGQGFSVREIIGAAERITGSKIPYQVENRRVGDPAILVASSKKARAELGWSPRYASIDSIIASAWNWHRSERH